MRALRPHEWILDGVLALAIATLAGLSSVLFPADGAAMAVHLLALVVTCSAVAIRRWRPGLALAVVSLGAILQMCSGWPPDLMNASELIVVFSCAALGTRRVRWIALGASVAGAAVAAGYTWLILANALSVDATATATTPEGAAAFVAIASFVAYLAVLVSSWLLGLVRFIVLRAREAQVARRIAEVEGEHSRAAAETERERARIAREMHDVLAHSLVVVATLSDGAKLAVRSAPEDAERAISTIGEVSRDALADVRRLLAELRHEQDAGAAETFEEAPELIARFEELGLRVERRIEGEPGRLTAGASLAAYRALQEGLTNALRHGDATRPVRVVERWGEERLDLLVENSCATGAPSFPSGGHGLLGLRERLALEGGRLFAARAGDEFRLDAAIPVGRAASVPKGPLEAGTMGADPAPDPDPATHEEHLA